VDPESLAQVLMADPEIRGLTISGGEPILQANALMNLIQAAKAARDIDVILFTGYYLENLQAFPVTSSVHQLLDLLDVIIDGPYVSALNDNQGMRGSSNQRVIHLTNRLQGIDFTRHPRQTEIQIIDGELLFVGVPPTAVVPGVITNLGAMIRSSDEYQQIINLSFS